MREEEKIFAGQLFSPGDPELVALKLRSHNLSQEYSNTREDEYERRAELLKEIIGTLGVGVRFQGPIFFHYGCHSSIGDHCFFNYNTTIQDDAPVTIEAGCSFGPNLTIVTPIHPMVARERRCIRSPEGVPMVCYAKPVHIGKNCWFGANVVVCGGVTIGDGCVIGAGSVVTRDIPANTFAAGVPCRVVREITDADSMRHKPEILANNTILEED